MTQKESVNITKQKMRKAQTREEYSNAILTHFQKYLGHKPIKVAAEKTFDGGLF